VTTTKVWSEVQASGGDFTLEPGGRYAVLASVSSGQSLDAITKYVEGKGFHVTYAWETGQPSRATYQIDNWLQNLPPDATGGQRWVYAEGDYDGVDPWTVGEDPSWLASLALGHFYHVSHVFLAVDAPAPTTPSDTPTAPDLPGTSSSDSGNTNAGIGPWGVAAAVFSVGILAGAIWLNVRSPAAAMAEWI
jgi:hypothetical protein